ncbi:phage tail tube protein [Comamonas terrae]|uniref:Phage tail tube protein n=1 Tax=Comamonas terrae TaxID=673548 RepID=A0ABW5UT77_9BURK|nr:phage tail tube protein [Comamonas terrae]
MAEPIFWTNVGISVQTAVSEIFAIKSISKAVEALVVFEGQAPADLKDGAIVRLTDVNGMVALNDRAFRVKNFDGAAKSFILEGEDTSDYGNFTGGSAVVVTLGADFRSVQEVNASGGDFEKADITTVHGMLRRRRSTVQNPVTFGFTNLFDMGDPGFKECVKAHRSKTTRVIQFSFGTGPKILAVGAPAATGVPTGQAQGVVQTPVDIECQGMPTALES